MNQPLISIVLCTYNGAAFLEAQLESIFNQTYPQIELIISDDASTDDTAQILQKYADRPGLTLILNTQNIGLIKNFERTALMAKGEYIAFADQDDIWLPNKIERLHAAIGKYPLVYSNSEMIDENGNSIHKSLSDIRILKNISDSRCLVFANVVSGHAMMIRKELLDSAFPIPSNFFHDWWMAAVATGKGGVLYLDEKLTLYRQHRNTATKNIVVNKMPSRKAAKRYQDFKITLGYIDALKQKCTPKDLPFFTQLFNLFSLKENKRFVWPLFWFLLKNKQDIFRLYKKSFLSKLIEIRKLSRGENAG